MSGPHLLLDFGGVVLLTPFELRDRGERSLGLKPGCLSWQGPFDPDTDPLWQVFQAGHITERQYWAARSAEFDLDTKGFMRHLYDPPGPDLLRSEMVALIDRARSDDRKVGILTNDLRAFHGPEWMAAFPLFDAVDTLVDGSVTGVLKPHPEAFHKALAGLGCDPADTVFVDDQPVNLSGAEAVGLIPVFFDVTRPVESAAVAAAALSLP